MSFSEPSINAVLADLLFDRISGWFGKLISGYVVKYGKRRAEIDLFMEELFGLRIAMEAKLGHEKIDDAVKQCKDRLNDGLADICIAVAYSDDVKNARNAEEVKQILKSGKLRIKLIAPDASEIDLGETNLDTFIETLDKHHIYDKVVGKELVEEIAKEIRQHLDEVDRLEQRILDYIATTIEQSFEIHGGVTDEEEEEEE